MVQNISLRYQFEVKTQTVYLLLKVKTSTKSKRSVCDVEVLVAKV